MRKGSPLSPELRMNQAFKQSPFSFPQVFNIRQKIMKHYIPKTELIKSVSKNRRTKGKCKNDLMHVEVVPRDAVSLSPSPHKINLGFESSLSFDLSKNSKAKRFKPHLTYFKLAQKPGAVPASAMSSEEKFRLIIKGLQYYYSSGTTFFALQHFQGFITFILIKVLPT